MTLEDKKPLRILLINPPHVQPKGQYPRIVFEPLGLAYIAACLEKDGFQVEILDTIGEGFENRTKLENNKELVGLSYCEIRQRINEYKPGLVGISIHFTVRAESAFAIASIVKQINEKTVTIVGGIHPSTYTTECLDNDSVDFVCIGEGEFAMLEMAKSLQQGNMDKAYSINGLAYKRNGKILHNRPQIPIDDLNAIPFPARHLLPMEKYFQASRKFNTGRHGKKFACIITSRGCPFKCVFCVSYRVMGRKWRYRSPENVVDEIEQLVKEYGIKFFHFEDDNLTFDKKRTERICELIIERKLKIKWDTPNGIRADTIADKNVLSKMKKSGCWYICVAPESGNPYVVKNIIKKNMDLAKVETTVRLCKEIGLKVEAFFVIGMVGETKEQIQDTVSFAARLRKLGVSRCHFHIATPFKGTDIYHAAKQKGFLRDIPKDSSNMEMLRIETDDFTLQDIDEFMMAGNRTNSIVPWDKIGIVRHLLFRNPIKLAKASFGYLLRRSGNLS